MNSICSVVLYNSVVLAGISMYLLLLHRFARQMFYARRFLPHAFVWLCATCVGMCFREWNTTWMWGGVALFFLSGSVAVVPFVVWWHIVRLQELTELADYWRAVAEQHVQLLSRQENQQWQTALSDPSESTHLGPPQEPMREREV